MKLIGSYTSPFVRKIRIALSEKELPFEFVEEIPWNADSPVPQLNPLGKVPVLQEATGRCWHDSPVIAEFIETLDGAVCRLVPADPVEAVEVRQIEALADGLCEAGVAIFLERKRVPQEQSAAWIARQEGKLRKGLEAVEALVADAQAAGRNTLHPSGFSLGDIAVGAVVEWLLFRMAEIVPPASEALSAYLRRLGARPSFLATQPPAG